MCPVCREENYGSHAPDGRCDYCAEEHGCDCGCYPSPGRRLQAEFYAVEGDVEWSKDHNDIWRGTFTSKLSGRKTVF